MQANSRSLLPEKSGNTFTGEPENFYQ